jgi:hypothetical protein
VPDELTDSPTAEPASTGKSVQQGVLSELAAVHARDVRSISLVNAVAATVSPGAARVLAANPAVEEMVPDLPIPVATSLSVRPAKAAAGLAPLPGACAPNGQVQLVPEAIEAIHAATASGTGSSPRRSATPGQA